MMGAQPLWWLALPVLLLPLWWHRQKRRRTEAEPLATARFLPPAPPQQRRIWRWDELPLLLLRCLLLLALIAWLAAVALPWRGDTVLVGRDVPAAWADQQAAQAGMAGAQRLVLPLTQPANAVLSWLQTHEHAWRQDAKLLVLAQQVALPAQLPKLAHAVEIRIAPAAPAAPEPAPAAAAQTAAAAQQGRLAAPVTHPTPLPIALVAPPERKAAWHALFAAFDAAGNGAVRHVVTEFDGAQAPSQAPPRAALIVWDRAAPPPPGWQAPLWWLPTAALPLVAGVDAAAVQALRVDGLAWQVADSARGRLWASDAWPPQDADRARTLYETWRALHFAPDPWPLAAQVLPPQRTSALAMPDTRPDAWLAYVLLALFMLERLVTHVRRR